MKAAWLRAAALVVTFTSVWSAVHAEAQSVEHEFDVVNIKPVNRSGGGFPFVGFVADPGGKVQVGNATVELLVHFAYDVERFQISGMPDWAATEHYDIQALPPNSAPSRTETLKRATPTADERAMLRKMLADRFALKVHHETHQSTVYVLTRGPGKLLLQPPARTGCGCTLRCVDQVWRHCRRRGVRPKHLHARPGANAYDCA